MVGGGSASSIPKLMLEKTQADITVIGEGENTVVEILNTIDQGSNLSGVKGIFFKENGHIHQNPPAPPIENIDSS